MEKAYTKEQYETFLKEAQFDTYEGVARIRKQFEEFALTQPRKYAEIVELHRTGVSIYQTHSV